MFQRCCTAKFDSVQSFQHILPFVTLLLIMSVHTVISGAFLIVISQVFENDLLCCLTPPPLSYDIILHLPCNGFGQRKHSVNSLMREGAWVLSAYFLNKYINTFMIKSDVIVSHQLVDSTVERFFYFTPFILNYPTY